MEFEDGVWVLDPQQIGCCCAVMMTLLRGSDVSCVSDAVHACLSPTGG